MRKLSLCCVLFMPLLIHGQSPPSRYIIQLTDKKGSPFTLADPLAYLSAGSVQRRVRQQIVPDSTDLPIPSAYLDSIGAVPNVIILNKSKWLNQVLISTTDPAALATLRSFSFVRGPLSVAMAIVIPIQAGSAKKKISGIHGMTTVRRVFGMKRNEREGSGVISRAGANVNSEAGSEAASGAGANLINYGSSFAQIHIHKGEYLHNLGFSGQGMTIAIIDDGFFGYLSNPAFDSAQLKGQILGSWDFVNGKQSVNEEDVHGTHCLSIIASDQPGLLVGSAPGAKFWLFKTEDLNSETPVEEQNWAAAAEFADSVGADMITTSLGYVNFDDPSLDHSYAQRDGHTAISTRAANFAVGKGMIVLASAGNSGADTGDTKYVGCPGDADSALTVGAVDVGGRIAAFSSWGPNSSGRIKPDVVSVGEGTVIANPDGSPTTGDGTSYSTPNMAGLVACLWQAFPEFTNHAILDAVRQSSSNALSPDGRYGYGLPDLQKAYGLLQEARGVNAILSRGSPWISAFPVPYTDDLTVVLQAQNSGSAGLSLIDAIGRTMERESLTTVMGQWYTVHFASASGLSAGVYFIRYEDGRQHAVLQVVRK